MRVQIQSVVHGSQYVNVCDNCRTVCVPPPGRFCSGSCSRKFFERRDKVDREGSVKKIAKGVPHV